MSYRLFKSAVVVMISVSAFASMVRAETESAAEMDKEAAQVEQIKAKDEAWNRQLKERYNLTDEQMKKLQESGLSSPQMAMAAELAKLSQKPLDEILKMRIEQKMGWGKIAKELGVHPGELGHAVRDLRHALRDERKEAHNERKEKAEKRKDARNDREDRDDRREENHGNKFGRK